MLSNFVTYVSCFHLVNYDKKYVDTTYQDLTNEYQLPLIFLLYHTLDFAKF